MRNPVMGRDADHIIEWNRRVYTVLLRMDKAAAPVGLPLNDTLTKVAARAYLDGLDPHTAADRIVAAARNPEVE